MSSSSNQMRKNKYALGHTHGTSQLVTLTKSQSYKK